MSVATDDFMLYMSTMVDNFITRTLGGTLENAIEKPYIVSLVGARQVGKSTLLDKLLPNGRTLKINFDSSELRARTLRDENYFLKELEKLNRGPLSSAGQRLYLYVDEAQKLPESFEIVKQLHDEYAYLI